MARLGVLLAVTAALVVAVGPSAQADVFATDGFGLAGNPSGDLHDHANQFARDGLASSCGDGMAQSSPIITPGVRRAYKSRAFTSLINEDACVTASVSTSCTGSNEIMSATFSPAFDPETINSNWIGDLGHSPPNQTSYSFPVAAGARFETVASEQEPTGNCGGVDLTWSSDRPWARSRPSAFGAPAIGRTLTRGLSVWAGTPSVTTQWQRCDVAGNGCTDIPGATGTSYVVTDADLGRTMGVRETATEGGLTSTVDGRAMSIPVFIAAESLENASLASGDSATSAGLNTNTTPSRCGAPKPAPGASVSAPRFFDTYTRSSIVNEPVCVWLIHEGCLATTAVYSPQFVPADIRQNYVADDSGSFALSFSLAPGTSATAVVYEAFPGAGCPSYSMVVGSDGPFATDRPQIGGAPTAGTPLATTNGTWTGTPAFAYAWMRCDAAGGGCAPIAGADGASYTPTANDIGSTLRSRVTATQGKSLSADSSRSAVVAAAPPGGSGPGADGTGPNARLALARTTLQKVVKQGFIPVTVTCDEACTLALRADVTRKLGKRLGGVKIASGKGKGQAAKRVTIKVRLTRKARKGLRRMKSVSFTLKATATDAAANTSTATKKAKLKRKRRRSPYG
jgi:hypothetical protein